MSREHNLTGRELTLILAFEFVVLFLMVVNAFRTQASPKSLVLRL